MDLSKAQDFDIYEVIKVVIVSKNKHFVLAIFQIMVPCFKNLNNSQKRTIINLVSSFYRNYFPKKKDYQIPLV